MNEKTIGILGTLGSILLGIIAVAIAWFCGGKELQGKTREVIKVMFNFEILLCIVGLILNFIPVIGTLIAFVILPVNIIVSIMAFMALNNNTEFKLPIPELIK